METCISSTTKTASFDVAYANQVFQHLTDQPRALSEMRRVLKSGGLLCVRETDYATMSPAPKFPEFEEWSSLYHRVAYQNGAEPDAGRYLARWVREAGFADYEIHYQRCGDGRRRGALLGQYVVAANSALERR